MKSLEDVISVVSEHEGRIQTGEKVQELMQDMLVRLEDKVDDVRTYLLALMTSCAGGLVLYLLSLLVKR